MNLIKKFFFYQLGLTFFLLASAPLHAAEPAKTPLDKETIEKVLREVLRTNPEIVVEAIEAYRAKQEAEKANKAREALASRRKELNGGAMTPIGGNPKGTVTVVEFFDYQCGYCKRVFPSILALIQSDKRIRYVFKELPILGPASMLASRAAIAAWEIDQKKYLPFHTALMASRGRLNEGKILRIAKDSGINPDELQKQMKEPEVFQELQNNLNLAQALNINGTPAFIIGNQIIPGAVSLDELKRMVEAENKS
ncbi:MAG: DsbA family protein [Rhodospirillales bacterium]|jgi:protein-disulfide isomerase